MRALAAVGLLPIAVSALIGVGLMLALGCLTWRDATHSLSAPVIMIIVTSLALGKAIMGTIIIITGDLNSIRLRAGDVLLVQGTRDAIDTLKSSGSMLVLDGTTELGARAL